MGVPIISCCLVVAHCALHSGKQTARDFCSLPFGLVQSYIHLLKHASYFGSCFVPASKAAVVVVVSDAMAIRGDVVVIAMDTVVAPHHTTADRITSFRHTTVVLEDEDDAIGAIIGWRCAPVFEELDVMVNVTCSFVCDDTIPLPLPLLLLLLLQREQL
jgi:hypothetical protein